MTNKNHKHLRYLIVMTNKEMINVYLVIIDKINALGAFHLRKAHNYKVKYI